MPTTKIYYLSDGEDGEVRYVGKTSSTLKLRMQGHMRDVRRMNNHRSHWLAATHCVCMHLVAEVEGDGCAQEIELIASLRKLGARLVNGTAGGDGSKGWNPSEATRAKMRAAQTGRKHTAATRAKIGAASKGHTKSAATLEKMSASMKSSPAAMEWVYRLIASNRGRKHTAATRAKISAAMQGHAVSTETLEKISAAQKGRRKSPDVVARMTAAQRKRRMSE